MIPAGAHAGFDPSQPLVTLRSLVQTHFLTQDPPTTQP